MFSIRFPWMYQKVFGKHEGTTKKQLSPAGILVYIMGLTLIAVAATAIGYIIQ